MLEPRTSEANGAAPAEPAAVEGHAVTKVFGEGPTEVRALDGVDFVVGKGEFVAVMGPSGCGKSTLLHILGALETPTAGSVAVGGRHYEGLDDKELTRLRREHIGFVFQFFNLLPSLTAHENVYLPALISRRRGKALEPGRWSCCSASESASGRSTARRSCPEASNSVSRSPARCCSVPSSC